MGSHKKLTPLSQRGIAAYLTGPNSTTYAQIKDSEPPPPQQDRPVITPDTGVLSGGAVVGNTSATIQLPAAIPVNADPHAITTGVQGEREQRKRKLSSIQQDDRDSEGGDGDCSSKHGDARRCKTPNPAAHYCAKGRPRAPTQRTRKGQSDGAWREQQNRNPNRWQMSYSVKYPWAERVLPDASRGEVHDQVRCVLCTLRKKSDGLMACRAATLDAHAASQGHKKSVALHQDQDQDQQPRPALQQQQNATLPKLFGRGAGQQQLRGPSRAAA
jgi:hypothetical protein